MLGPGPRFIKQGIYRAAVSQRLRNTTLCNTARIAPNTPVRGDHLLDYHFQVYMYLFYIYTRMCTSPPLFFVGTLCSYCIILNTHTHFLMRIFSLEVNRSFKIYTVNYDKDNGHVIFSKHAQKWYVFRHPFG